MAKLLGIAILIVGMIIVVTLIGTVFLYAGWNWGLVPALAGSKMALHHADLFTMFWLSMFFSTLGSFFKTSVSSGKD